MLTGLGEEAQVQDRGEGRMVKQGLGIQAGSEAGDLHHQWVQVKGRASAEPWASTEQRLGGERPAQGPGGGDKALEPRRGEGVSSSVQGAGRSGTRGLGTDPWVWQCEGHRDLDECFRGTTGRCLAGVGSRDKNISDNVRGRTSESRSLHKCNTCPLSPKTTSSNTPGKMVRIHFVRKAGSN